MKFLFFYTIALLILMAISSGISAEDEKLKKLATNILSASKSLKRDLTGFINLLRDLGVEGLPYSPFFFTFIRNNSEVSQIEQKLTDSVKNLTGSCGFNDKVKSVNTILEDMTKIILNQKAQTVLKEHKENIITLLKEIDAIESALKNQLDAEIVKCNNSDPTCKITEQTVEHLNDKILLYEAEHMQLVYLWNHVREQLDKDKVSKVIKEKIIQPMNDCLEKSQTSEEHSTNPTSTTDS